MQIADFSGLFVFLQDEGKGERRKKRFVKRAITRACMNIIRPENDVKLFLKFSKIFTVINVCVGSRCGG